MQRKLWSYLHSYLNSPRTSPQLNKFWERWYTHVVYLYGIKCKKKRFILTCKKAKGERRTHVSSLFLSVILWTFRDNDQDMESAIRKRQERVTGSRVTQNYLMLYNCRSSKVTSSCTVVMTAFRTRHSKRILIVNRKNLIRPVHALVIEFSIKVIRVIWIDYITQRLSTLWNLSALKFMTKGHNFLLCRTYLPYSLFI